MQACSTRLSAIFHIAHAFASRFLAGVGGGAKRPSGLNRMRVPATVRYTKRHGVTTHGPVLLLVLALGCAGPPSLSHAPLEAGRSMLIQAPAERVLPVARTAVRDAGFQIERELREAGRAWSISGRVLLTDQALAADVRVVVEEVAEDRTEVRVLTRRYLPTRVGGRDPYADAIFDRLVREFVPHPAPESERGS